mmetsp:Transcript_172862/g.554212  ORF Transcript_172862/g.554212 Transcript_172862/m.554212 type:complete len:203 (-) Transcript_172862:1494-2102(-)
MRVWPRSSSSRAELTMTAAVPRSRLERTSSSSKAEGPRNARARASASRAFCPPLKFKPRKPISQSSLPGKPHTSSSKPADLKADHARSSERHSAPPSAFTESPSTFSPIVPLTTHGSCGQKAARGLPLLHVVPSTHPPGLNSEVPPFFGIHPSSAAHSELLPEPEGPTTQQSSPGLTCKVCTVSWGDTDSCRLCRDSPCVVP